MSISNYNETVIILHPLSYRRGGLVDFLIFLTKKGSLIGNITKTNICATTADILKWTYNDDGWGAAKPTVAFICYCPDPVDDVMGFYTAAECKPDTLKGYFYSKDLSKHDSLIEYSNTVSKTLLYKDMFSL